MTPPDSDTAQRPRRHRSGARSARSTGAVARLAVVALAAVAVAVVKLSGGHGDGPSRSPVPPAPVRYLGVFEPDASNQDLVSAITGASNNAVSRRAERLRAERDHSAQAGEQRP